MPNYSVQAILENDSALPEDVVVNHWSFSATGLPALEDVDNQLRDFYNDIDGLLSKDLSGNLTIKIYDRADPAPRVPVYVTSDTFGVVGTTALPNQVALVLSFQAVAISGLPQSRRRNRVFLGPFAGDANELASGMPEASTVSTVATAAETLLAASEAAANYTWQVWSPTNDNGLTVDNGWVDNRWDTQRRRLPRPTARVTFG